MEIKDLIDHLNGEAGLLKDLVAVLHRETECIVARDYKGLYETTGQKEHLVVRINASGGERDRLLRGCLASRGAKESDSPAVSTLVELAGKDAPELDECHKKLLSLSSSVMEINRLNSVITESSIGNVAKTLGFLGNFLQPSTYKASGSFEGFAVKGSRLSEGA